jgi:PII-like signaling protein
MFAKVIVAIVAYLAIAGACVARGLVKFGHELTAF